ncbi:MAG: hypothetical protein WD873_08045, partial [Candidatus Hydrogenedentales bacterium]
PFAALAALLTLGMSLPPILRRNDGAPLLVLLLSGLIFGFWWLFFSSGHIPRYLWYFWVIVAVFAGPVLVNCIVRAQQLPRPALQFRHAAFVILLVAPAVARFAGYIDRVYRYEELGDEIAAGEYIRRLPQDDAVATTWWPAERSANFFAGRVIALADADAPQAGWLIRNASVETIPESDLARATRIGRYAILPPSPQIYQTD